MRAAVLLGALALAGCGKGYDFGERLRAATASAAAIHNAGMPNAQHRAPSGRFLRSQYIEGFNRICVYDRMGSTEIVTIPNTSFCTLD